MRLVLDTNVVLDWLYFRDPGCAKLGAAVMQGHVRWIASTAMRAELQHVLERGMRADRPVDVALILQIWDRHATMIEAGDTPSARALRCTDTSDQKFIDLAVQVRASALLSADRAVLKLARRAAAQGLQILQVGAWRAPEPMLPRLL